MAQHPGDIRGGALAGGRDMWFNNVILKYVYVCNYVYVLCMLCCVVGIFGHL
jgi:hypothetical protein